MRRAFVSDEHQKHFDENGFVLLDFYTPQQVEAINKIYHDNRLPESLGLEVTIKGGSFEANKRIQEMTSAIALESVNRILLDYRIFYSGYVTKIPNKHNVSRLHQDPTFVDEAQCKSFDIWSPMIETNEKNGALYMIRNSNRFFPGYRGYTCAQYDYNDIRMEIQEKYGTILRMKPGQAVIYDTAMLHFSYQNETDQIRVAYTCLVGPAEAQMIYFHHNKAQNTLDIYNTDDDFIVSYYQKYLKKDELDLPLVSRKPFEAPVKVSFPEFEEKYRLYNSSTTP